jgi:hypothetical protein
VHCFRHYLYWPHTWQPLRETKDHRATSELTMPAARRS